MARFKNASYTMLLLLAAAKQLTVEDISEAFIQTRENRKSGELIETKQ